MRSQRWIWVGSYLSGVFVQLWNCGYPKGYWLNWHAGRVGFAQPNAFTSFRDLLEAVRYRLAMAGLALVAVASSWRRATDYTRLYALVERQGGALRVLADCRARPTS